MRAGEGALYCFAKRNVSSVADHHHGPGDRLQSKPLQPDRQAKGNYRDGSTDKAKHIQSLPSRLPVSQTTGTRRTNLGG